MRAVVKKNGEIVKKTGMAVRKNLTSGVMGEEERVEEQGDVRRGQYHPQGVWKRSGHYFSDTPEGVPGTETELFIRNETVPWKRSRTGIKAYDRNGTTVQAEVVWSRKLDETVEQRRKNGMLRQKQISSGKEKVRSEIPVSPTAGKAAGTGQQTAAAATRTIQNETLKKGASSAGKAATAASGAATAGTTTAAVAVYEAAEAAKKAAEYVKENLVRSIDKEQIQTDKNRNGTGGILLVAGLAAGFFMIVFLMFAGVLLPVAEYGQKQKQEQERQEQILSRSRIVSVAYGEVSKSNTGGTKYKKWYGMNDNWCAMFVSWCGDQCGYLKAGIMPKTASVATMKKWYQDRNEYYTKESGYEPCPGDIIIFGNGRSHTGIVVNYDATTKTVTTVEGNAGTSETTPYHAGSHVTEKKYPLTYRTIAGYGSPDYPAEESATENTEKITEPTEEKGEENADTNQ